MKRQVDRDGSMRMKKNRGRSPFNRRSYRDNSPDYRYNARDARRNIQQNRYPSHRSPAQSPRYTPPIESSRGRRNYRDQDDVYNVLLIRNFSSQLNREDIQESLEYEFRKFGEVSVEVTRDHKNDRVAYATFRDPEDARACKNAKGHLVMHDRRLSIAIAYDEPPDDRYSPRDRSPYGHDSQYSPVRGRSPVGMRSSPRRRSPKRMSMGGRSYMPRERQSYGDKYSPRTRMPAKEKRISGNQSPSRDRYSSRERDSPPMDSPSARNRSSSRDRSPMSTSESHDRRRSGSRDASPDKKRSDSKDKNAAPASNTNVTTSGFADNNFFPTPGIFDKPIPPEDDPCATRTLFVGNLEPDVSTYELRRLFEPYGDIKDIDVKRAARGQGAYCFIKFADLNQAYKAKVNLNGKPILNSISRIGYGKVLISSKIWVGGLGDWTTLQDLEREFERFGPMRRIDYRRGDDSAIVLYETIEAAQAACSQMRGFLMPNAETRLRMDFLEPEVGMPGYDNYSEWGRHDNMQNQSSSDRFSSSKYKSQSNSSRYRGRNVFADDRKSDRRGRSSRSRSPRGKRLKNKSATIHETAMTEMQLKRFHAKSCYSLHDLCEVFDPPCWQGGFILKKIAFPVLFFLLEGDMGVFNTTTADPNSSTGRQTMFHVTQRLRLTEDNVKEVGRRMKYCEGKSCLMVCVPGVPENLNMGGTKSGPAPKQHKPLRGLVKYFKEKEAAAIINVPLITKDKDADKEGKEKEISGVIHAFPPCPFTSEQLLKIGPSLQPQFFADDYMFAILVKGSPSVLL